MPYRTRVLFYARRYRGTGLQARPVLPYVEEFVRILVLTCRGTS